MAIKEKKKEEETDSTEMNESTSKPSTASMSLQTFHQPTHQTKQHTHTSDFHRGGSLKACVFEDLSPSKLLVIFLTITQRDNNPLLNEKDIKASSTRCVSQL